MTSVGGKVGKCSNFGNCSLADARTAQDIPSGVDFVCGECGKPVLLTDAGKPTGSQSATVIVVGLLVVLLLAGGAIVWSLLKGEKKEEKRDAPAVAAPAAPRDAVAAPPAPKPLAPETGNCSDADAQVGICRKKP